MTVASQQTTVGIIGLGAMGRHIAHHVARTGFTVSVHSRRNDLRQEFEAVGATWCDTPAGVATGASIILVVVALESELEAVLFEPGNLVAAIAPGTVICDLGTHSPSGMVAAEAAAKEVGATFIDTPVSGGVEGASAGTLSLMAGGDVAALDRVRPVLASFASRVIHFGRIGSGQVAKACNQLVVGSTIEAVAEAITLARLSGLDPARLREALLGGFAASRILELHGQRMLDGAFESGARIDLHAKDARIVLDQARSVGLELPGFEPVAEALEAMVAAGDGRLDHSALITRLDSDPA